MSDWIEHDGGPQPVADDVWVEIKWPIAGGHFLEEPDEIDQASELPWEGNKLRYRILNQHLIDALRDDLETWQSVFPHVMPDRLKSDQQLAEEDVAAKIDAARLEGIRLGLEAAVRACQAQAEDFLSPAYAVDQPLSSFAERFACGRCADETRALNPDTIAREAQDMGSEKEAKDD